MAIPFYPYWQCDYTQAMQGAIASGTYQQVPNSPNSPNYLEEQLIREKQFIQDRKNKQMQLAWKKDQYVKVKGRFKI